MNIMLTAWNIIWTRFHNLQAKNLSAENSTWNDEEIFHAARNLVIGVYQVRPISFKLVKF